MKLSNDEERFAEWRADLLDDRPAMLDATRCNRCEKSLQGYEVYAVLLAGDGMKYVTMVHENCANPDDDVIAIFEPSRDDLPLPRRR